MKLTVRIIRSALLSGCGAAWLAVPALADGPGLSIPRVDATQFPIVRVYASAATAEGIPITGLDARAFELREDDKSVEGLQVEPIVDSQEPIVTALAVDVSGSMNDEGKLDAAKDAASAFIDTLGPADSATVVSFATQVKVVTDYVSDNAALKKALGSLVANGDTLLYDAVAQTAQRQAKQVQRRKAIVLLTDGEDTRSKETLETSIAAAQAAGSPVFAIGLGSDVNKDVLNRLATATGGQAVFVADPGLLKQTFLSVGDQLRRQYVLRYTSHLKPDDKPHTLAARLSYVGQEATAQSSFTPPKLVAPLAINGLPATGVADGPQRISVDAPGGATLVQLLVDDQVRGGLKSPPFVFDWDPTTETPGQHRVVIRAVDAQGETTDKTYLMTVPAPPAPAPTVAPTAAPLPPTVVPAVVPAVGPATSASIVRTVDDGANWWAIGVVVLICLILLAVAVAVGLASRRLHLAPAGAPAAGQSSSNDNTELVGVRGAADATWIRPRAATPTATARLRIAGGGQDREVVIDCAETTIGRDDRVTIPIKDPLASRTHAVLVCDDNEFWIEDKNSLNGTQVNGRAIKRQKLENNDRIVIGETTFTFVDGTRRDDVSQTGRAR